MDPASTNKGIITQASSLSAEDVRQRWSAEESTSTEGAYTGQEAALEAGLPLSLLSSLPREAVEDGSWGGRGGDYLESIANSGLKLKQPAYPGWFVAGICEQGEHVFYRMTYCGREWCGVCREPMHKRRIARWLPKAFQVKSMGYLVVTILPEDRARFRTKAVLSQAGKRATTVIRQLFRRGLRRWHWFGDKDQDYHPHLNYLVEGGYMSRHELREPKRERKRV